MDLVIKNKMDSKDVMKLYIWGCLFTIFQKSLQKESPFIDLLLHPHEYVLVLKSLTFATFTPSIHTTPEFSPDQLKQSFGNAAG